MRQAARFALSLILVAAAESDLAQGPPTPSVETAAQKTTSTANVATVSDVVIALPAGTLRGKVTVDRSGIRFCCSSFEPDGGARTGVQCRYSVVVPAADIKQQFVAGTTLQKWHVVTKTNVDFEFATPDSRNLAQAVATVRKNFPSVTTLGKPTATMLKALVAPAIREGRAACE